MARLLLIFSLLSYQHLGCLSEECPQYRKNIEWMNGEKGFEGSFLPKSVRECQLWCQEYYEYYEHTYPCVGWSFWADPGPWSSSSWCFLFRNESELLQNTAHPSPGAVSGLKMDCDSDKGPTIAEYFLEGVDFLNRTHWKNFLADDTDADQDGNISDNEIELAFKSYMGELFKMMDQDKDEIVTEEELRSLRIDLLGLNKVVDITLKNWPLKSVLLAADTNKDSLYDDNDFYTPAKLLQEPLDEPKRDDVMIKTDATLVDKNSPKEGNVFINSNYLCEIGEKEGNVVCKSLGFGGGLDQRSSGLNRNSNVRPTNQKYICNGTETRLEDCQRTECDKYVQYVRRITCGEKIGSLHLVGGKDSSSGDIFLGNEGLGCSPFPISSRRYQRSGKLNKAAEVICRELGFLGFIKTTTGSTFTKHIYPRPRVFDKGFECKGNETMLIECPQKRSSSCHKESIWGIICKTDDRDEMVVNKHLEGMLDWNRYSWEFEKYGRILLTADTNNDGKSSLEEIKAKIKAFLASIFYFVDQLGDGQMSVEAIHEIMDQFFSYRTGKDGEIDLMKAMFMYLDFGYNNQYLYDDRTFDNNNDGKLNAEDFHSGERRFRTIHDYIIPPLSYKLDKNQDGKIKRQELRHFTDDMFRKIDIDGSGTFTSGDLYNLMRDNGFSCLRVEAIRSHISHVTNTIKTEFMKLMTYLFKELDLDGNGEIGLKEFYRMHVPCATSHAKLAQNPDRRLCSKLFDQFLREYEEVLNSFLVYFLRGAGLDDRWPQGNEVANAACRMMI